MESFRSRHGIVPPLLVLATAALAACGGQTDQQTVEDTAEAETAAAETALPDTTAASLWSYLDEVGYQNAWSPWPGKGELYAGTEPHGMLLTTYLNDPAHDALTGPAGSMPNDAIIVKENYAPDSTLAAVTVMYKKQGYDAEHNDWFWVKYLPDGSVDAEGQASGRVQGCIDCHGGAADNDYVMTASLSESDGGSGS